MVKPLNRGLNKDKSVISVGTKCGRSASNYSYLSLRYVLHLRLSSPSSTPFLKRSC